MTSESRRRFASAAFFLIAFLVSTLISLLPLISNNLILLIVITSSTLLTIVILIVPYCKGKRWAWWTIVVVDLLMPLAQWRSLIDRLGNLGLTVMLTLLLWLIAVGLSFRDFNFRK
ncbi:MAG: hypothetical protein ABSD49_12550 [Candidatus Bathyarchaeia archaeon]